MTTLTVEREVRCAKCGGRISANTEVDYLHAAGGFKPEYRHLQCPEKKKTAGRTPTQQIDHDDLFALRKCSREGPRWVEGVKWTRESVNHCGKTFSFPKGDRVPRRCPECDAEWSTIAFWEAA